MTNKKDISHFKILDWDFYAENSRMYLHNFCWYPSRFIPIIPAYLIQALSNPGETVFDPFCGSGTTLIEAIKQNRNAIGIDLNPVGCFISKTKCNIIIGNEVNIKEIEELRDHILELSLQGEKLEIEHIPNIEINQAWYHPDTLKMLGHLFYAIDNLPAGITRDVCRVFFISILMPSSGIDSNKPYTYYADNVRPKKNNKLFKDAIKLYFIKINLFLKEMNEYTQLCSSPSGLKFTIFNDDAKHLACLVKDNIDLIITSPPYLNVTDYTTGFRLAYLWYDFLMKDHSEMEQLKRKEIGARWRRKQQTRLDDYLTDMQFILAEMKTVLKKNGYLCLILGEPKKYYALLRDKIIAYVIENLNFEFIESFDRIISKKFFIHPDGGGVHNEGILIFRK